jgi:hypothetical protein
VFRRARPKGIVVACLLDLLDVTDQAIAGD